MYNIFLALSSNVLLRCKLRLIYMSSVVNYYSVRHFGFLLTVPLSLTDFGQRCQSSTLWAFAIFSLSLMDLTQGLGFSVVVALLLLLFSNKRSFGRINALAYPRTITHYQDFSRHFNPYNFCVDKKT